MDDVEAAGGVGGAVVERWEDDAGSQAQQGGSEFQGAGAGSGVPELALEGGDGNLLGASAEEIVDRGGFFGVAAGAAEAEGVDVADVVGSDSSIAECGSCGIHKGELKVGSALFVDHTGRAGAEDRAVDRGSARGGEGFGFEDDRAGSFAQDLAVASGVERAAPGFRRLAGMIGEFVLQSRVNPLDASGARAGCAGDHHVSLVAPHDAEGFADRSVAGGFVEGQRVARPARVGQDADVARGHVRQVLEQPERLHRTHAAGTPAIVLKFVVFIGTGVGSPLQHIRRRVHLVGTELDADPFVSQFLDLQARMLDAEDRGEDSQLDVAAVDLEALALAFEPFCFGGLVGQFADLGPDAAGSRAVRDQRNRSDAARTSFES